MRTILVIEPGFVIAGLTRNLLTIKCFYEIAGQARNDKAIDLTQ